MSALRTSGARPLRVLHFSNGEARGGAEEHMLTLLGGLDRERFELLLACPPALQAELPDLPGDVRTMPWAPMTPWQAATGWRLARFVRRERVDVVHAHLSCASRAAAPWARLGGALMIETPHVREGWRRGWKRSARLDRAAGRLVHGYIAVSEANARYLREELGLPPAKIRTIRNGIDVARFTAPLPPACDPRLANGIAGDELLIVCAARLEPQKGHSVLLQALAQLPRAVFDRLRLVCLGEGSRRAALQQQARELGIAGRVLWPGFCRHIEHWLAVADVFVLPSFYEGLPLAAMEACAAGCAVVATAVDGTPEVVTDGDNGLLVPAGDPAALARALRRLGEDADARRAMGACGRRRAREEFDQSRQIAETAEYYAALAGAAAGARRPHGLACGAAEPAQAGEAPAGAGDAISIGRAPVPAATAALLAAIVEGVVGGWPATEAPLRALVLAGSVARGEGSWLAEAGATRLLGDAELLLILPDGARLPSPAVVAARLDRIQQCLHAAGLHASVSLTPVRDRYLRTLPAHIFGYELRHTGRVLWGDAGCLALIPDFAASEVPRSDAWRLLTNRIVELLPALDGAAQPAVAELYPWVKLYLDMATSYLIFAGGYAPTYAERAQRLQQACGRDAWATPALVRQVEACTAWKLEPTDPAPALFADSAFRVQALGRAEQLWCWELEQLTEAAPGTPRPELWQRWLQRQTPPSRWRGWLSAFRHGGAPARQAVRWLRMAHRASPRHWIYEAAAELAFTPPAPGRLRAWADCLPYPPADPPRQPRELAGAVVDNFQRLVQSTRA